MTMFKRKPDRPAGAVLIAIDRVDRMNVFTFAKDGQIFKIETLGTWDDDIPSWKRAAGLD